MNTFAKIAISTLFLFAYAPAFGHGMSQAGMNGMDGGNSHNTMTTQTQTNPVKTVTGPGPVNLSHMQHLQKEAASLMNQISKLDAELTTAKNLFGPNSPKVVAIERMLRRIGQRFLKVEAELGVKAI